MSRRPQRISSIEMTLMPFFDAGLSARPGLGLGEQNHGGLDLLRVGKDEIPVLGGTARHLKIDHPIGNPVDPHQFTVDLQKVVETVGFLDIQFRQ